jgi:hypothetical protein
VQAALVPCLLIAAALGVGACDGAGGTGDARGTAPPTGNGGRPVVPASTTPTERGVQPGRPRTPQAVVRGISGRRIALAGRTIRIDADTVTCGGSGRPAGRRGRQLMWTRFRCVQPTFPPGKVVGPDLVLVVQSVAPRDLVVTRRHLTSY